MATTCVGLASLAWLARPLVGELAPGKVFLHPVVLSPGEKLTFMMPAAVLTLLLVVICLNRVLLHAVAWLAAGSFANFGELLATGAVADYVRVGRHAYSPGDLYLSVGIALLALGALKVVVDARRRQQR